MSFDFKKQEVVDKTTFDIGIEALRTAFIQNLHQPAFFVFGADEENLPDAIGDMKKFFERLRISVELLANEAASISPEHKNTVFPSDIFPTTFRYCDFIRGSDGALDDAVTRSVGHPAAYQSLPVNLQVDIALAAKKLNRMDSFQILESWCKGSPQSEAALVCHTDSSQT
jgi:hypothetical protein